MSSQFCYCYFNIHTNSKHQKINYPICFAQCVNHTVLSQIGFDCRSSISALSIMAINSSCQKVCPYTDDCCFVQSVSRESELNIVVQMYTLTYDGRGLKSATLCTTRARGRRSNHLSYEVAEHLILSVSWQVELLFIYIALDKFCFVKPISIKL